MKVTLSKSPKRDKKFRVRFTNGTHVDFGQRGYSDYTIHKDRDRMYRYLVRHRRGGEKWGIRGVHTAGFWSRWLLWSKPSIEEATKLLKTKFGVSVH
jgi:hypothetical protein